MSGSVRSIHSLLARELTISEIKMVSGGQTCGEGNTEVTTEPTYDRVPGRGVAYLGHRQFRH
ncbi:hypothetical protein, partial [Sphingobium sp. CCH11-B1]|uniref:hypothetical protein n=1 Tax=Sphingobium sp. CCH11-B1 TaxID=1768781 RepID=UPI000A66EA80